MDSSLDRIYIRDLHLRCIVGLNEEERRKKQDVLIGIALAVDLRRAAATDDVADAVDYKAVKDRVIALVEASSCRLLERLAEEVARACLDDPRVAEARVTVDKPGALRFARSVAVEVCRRREG